MRLNRGRWRWKNLELIHMQNNLSNGLKERYIRDYNKGCSVDAMRVGNECSGNAQGEGKQFQIIFTKWVHGCVAKQQKQYNQLTSRWVKCQSKRGDSHWLDAGVLKPNLISRLLTFRFRMCYAYAFGFGRSVTLSASQISGIPKSTKSQLTSSKGADIEY